MTSTATRSSIPIGHEKRWAALARAFGKNSIPQTLLLSGPPHVGKWTFTVHFAQLLLCSNLTTDESGLPAPCETCRACHQVAIESFPDFMVFRPIVSSAKDEKDWVIAPEALEGSLISIEMARKFGRESLSKPLIGTRKVMAIYGADRMNPEAQNALLKTFEEPVQGTTILLVCDNPSQLLPTVLSRCWHLPLALVPDGAIRTWLQKSPSIEPEWIDQAVRIAAGRPGAARRELDRLQRAGNTAGGDEIDHDEDGAEEGGGSRAIQAARILHRIKNASPLGALALTEEAMRLAREWWSEDQVGEEARNSKKGDAKVLRSAVARFLDEITTAYRAQWVAHVGGGGSPKSARLEPDWPAALDQIRKTRHYILRNANTQLALDVMFGGLIALHHPANVQRAAGAPANTPHGMAGRANSQPAMPPGSASGPRRSR